MLVVAVACHLEMEWLLASLYRFLSDWRAYDSKSGLNEFIGCADPIISYVIVGHGGPMRFQKTNGNFFFSVRQVLYYYALKF